MSIRQYTIEVLAAHCDEPTMEEWLDGLSRLRPAGGHVSGADAVSAGRGADDRAIAGGRGRR
jgi:hypothetical protein